MSMFEKDRYVIQVCFLDSTLKQYDDCTELSYKDNFIQFYDEAGSVRIKTTIPYSAMHFCNCADRQEWLAVNSPVKEPERLTP
jgi:hypothetical protein